MIHFKNINKSEPYKRFKKEYSDAIYSDQKYIEAISISSFNTEVREVSSRYVNLKYICNDEFIFFTNYNSPKAHAFKSHNQISALIYWNCTNTQIRFKARIKKLTNKLNQQYFAIRAKEKNALAISSNQSNPIRSYNLVREKYNNTIENDDLTKCPSYWGGYSFTPYEIEFWKGDEFRLNKRDLYKKGKKSWKHLILEP